MCVSKRESSYLYSLGVLARFVVERKFKSAWNQACHCTFFVVNLHLERSRVYTTWGFYYYSKSQRIRNVDFVNNI